VNRDDLLIEREGAKVAVDPVSLDLLEGAELDYKDTLMGSYFAVANPNATASCGCGTSFAVD
jgi:iron-sulfur cluster insertion protein